MADNSVTGEPTIDGPTQESLTAGGEGPVRATQGSGVRRLRQRLFEPVDIASIAIFRILFGAVLFWEVWRFFSNDWVRKFYIDRTYYFKYFGFDWVQPWPDQWMYVHFAVAGILALCFMVGFLYRITSWFLFLCFAYWFLLDETRYLNHFYLVVLLIFLMALIPAHHAKSFDARRRREPWSQTIPTWCLWLLRAQVGLVYFYAGVAKLNGDWLRGIPLRQWLARRADYPLIGPLLETEAALWFFAYGGVLFDLLIVPALFWRRTRGLALASAVLFHTFNTWLFDIGIFPVLMMTATLLLLPPDWPRRVCLLFAPLPADQSASGLPTTPPIRSAQSTQGRRLIEVFLVTYLGLQVLLPLRHFLYPGDVHWTEEGHRFAWHMKLREKRAKPTSTAVDPRTGESWVVDHREFLSSAQSDRVGRWPDMCLQFAHFLREHYRDRGRDGVEIHVRSMASLNGREAQDLIDPAVDLSREPRNLWPADWILPLRAPRPE